MSNQRIAELESQVANLGADVIQLRQENERELERSNALQSKLAQAEAAILALRSYLWISHGSLAPYGDDGEMQCSCPAGGKPCDFLRDDLQHCINHHRTAIGKTANLVIQAEARIAELEEKGKALEFAAVNHQDLDALHAARQAFTRVRKERKS